MSNRHLPAESPVARLVFDPQTPTPLMSRGLDYLAAKEIADRGPSMDPVLLWSYEANAESGELFRMAFTRNTVCITTWNAIVILDMKDGSERWRFSPSRVPWYHGDEEPEQFPWFDETGPLVIAHEDMIYVPTVSGLHAFDAASGQERWRWNESPVGIESDGLLYLLSDNRICAVDPQTGAPRWEDGQWHGVAPDGIAIDENLVFIEDGTYGYDPDTDHNRDFSSDPRFLRALNPDTGEKVWHKRLEGWWLPFGPQAKNGRVFTRVVANSISALDGQTGAELWRFRGSCEMSLSHRAVTDDRIFVRYEHEQDQVLRALDAAAGTERWQFTRPNGYIYLDLVAEGNAYVSEFGQQSERRIWAIDATTGVQRWSVPGDWVVGVQSGIVYLGSYWDSLEDVNESRLQAFDAQTGTKLWSIDLPRGPIQSITATAVAVFVLTRKALYVLQASALSAREVPHKPRT